jgi:hypothetical protein
MPHARLWVALAMVASAASQGCTVLGLGIGSSMPRYADVPSSATDGIPVGSVVQVSRGEAGEATATGVFLRRDSEAVYIQDGGMPARRIPRSSILGVTRQGNYALEGLLVGAVLDAAFIAILFFEYKNAPVPGASVSGF